MASNFRCKGVLQKLAATLSFSICIFSLASGQTMVNIASDATDPTNRRDAEPSIAVNPRNPLEISVVTFSEGWGSGAKAPVWRSTDGGATWVKIFVISQPPSGGSGPSDQHIGYSANGNFFLAELDVKSSPVRTFNYIYRQEPAGGMTIIPGASYGDDQPQIGIDRSTGPCSNRIYSPWLRVKSIARSMVSNSTNSGVSLSDVEVGDNSAFPNRTTRISVAPNGDIYIVYKTREGSVGAAAPDFEKAHFRVLRSDDCGLTWGALGPSGVSVHGDAQVQTWYTNDFGNLAKGKKTNRARSSDGWIAVDPGSGDIYVVYVNRDSSGFGQLYVARSRDRGVSWTSNRVTDGTHHSAFPEIAVADNGAVGVLYIDYDDSGPRTIFRHRFARSFDNGQHWIDKLLQGMDPEPIANAPERGQNGGFLWGDYEGLTALGNTFYGVFTGESIGRTTLQLDPIFFTEPATSADTAQGAEPPKAWRINR
jgi:hypothetical protein